MIPSLAYTRAGEAVGNAYVAAIKAELRRVWREGARTGRRVRMAETQEMSVIERAARALCLADGLDSDRKFKSSDWSERTAPHEFAWHEYLPKARAVLEAIREPSEGMESAGVMEGDWNRDNLDLGVEAKKVWQAMIDAALSE